MKDTNNQSKIEKNAGFQNHPIINSAIESFTHGLEHMDMDDEKGRRFAFIHIDQAIELVMKEKLKNLGESIYRKNGKDTLTFYETLEALKEKGILVKERPFIEDLHDYRNNVQHKGLTPDQCTTNFYIKDKGYQFFRDFCLGELGITWREVEEIIKQNIKNLLINKGAVKEIFEDDFSSGLLTSKNWILGFWDSEACIENNYLKLYGGKKGGAYKDIIGIIEQGQKYRVLCKARKIPYQATCGFNIWLHDISGIREPARGGESGPIILKSDWDAIEVDFTGTDSHNLRIHLGYLPGAGEINIKEVRVVKI